MDIIKLVKCVFLVDISVFKSIGVVPQYGVCDVRYTNAITCARELYQCGIGHMHGVDSMHAPSAFRLLIILVGGRNSVVAR